MTAAAAITGRELRSYFLTPGGYVVAALFMAVNAGLFARFVFNQGEPASLRPIFAFSMIAFMLICPAITMRAVSEELRMGTIETLLTAPVRTADVVLGKFAAALVFLAVLLLPTLAFVGLLEAYGRPDYGELACGYLGVMLAGAAYLASGILFSCLTSNQVIAYLMTFFFWLLVLLATNLLPQTDLAGAGRAADLVPALDPNVRLRDFVIGLFDSANLVFFVSVTTVLLVAATALLDMRRWR